MPGLHDDEVVDGAAPTAAVSVYDGYLVDALGNVKGTIQVKVGKPNAKTGLAAVKATVFGLDGKKKALKAAGKGKAAIAAGGPTADYLLANYRVVMFSGWNTCTPEQYRVLCDYVKGGGTLVIGLCHLSTDDARNYTDPSPEKLVNGGDLTELCGLRVVGATGRKWWATAPSDEPNCLGFAARRRFGYMCLPLGKLEYAAPESAFEPLAVDDEDADPFILRCRNGKGQVLLMNWWSYPAAADMDVGCGAEEGGVGLAGRLYRYAAKLGRGNVCVTGPDFENPDEDCNWIVCSYFPDAGRICLLNLDYANERKCVLQQFGDKEFITLKGGEFRIVDSVKLDADEKLNLE